MIRFRSCILSVTVAVAAVALAHPAVAAPKPSPTPAASAAPAASPTPVPEALDVQIPRLEAAVKANPNDRDSMTQLANDYLQVNRYDLASQLSAKLLAGGSKTAQVYFIDGSSNYAMGRTDQGIASMEQAANLEPTNILILQALTQMYLRANRAADAERVAKRALTFNPTSKDATLNYGIVFVAEKKYDEARQQFEAAAKLDPTDPHPVVLEARTYAEQNSFPLALQLFDRALAINKNDMEALIGKAEVASGSHDVKTSIATYETILALQTDNIDKAAVTDQEAIAYAREKMDSDADATFRKAIDSYGSLPPAEIAYGDYLASKNDKAGSMREWTAALGPNRDNPDALARLGGTAARANDFNTAVADYKRLTEVVPSDPRAYLLLGQAYMADKNPNSARDAFKASYNLEHTPDALVGLAAADMQTKNDAEAVAIYEALDKNAPDLVKSNPGILYNLGKAYQGENQPQKAKVAYTRFLAFLKPGTQGYTEVKNLIASIDHPGSSSTPHPAPSATPKHS